VIDKIAQEERKTDKETNKKKGRGGEKQLKSNIKHLNIR
jgi:hypothetical protein